MEVLTPSGVLVIDHTVAQYMSVKSHGFSFHKSMKFNPTSHRREVGELILEISDSGVSLVKLREGVTFINEEALPAIRLNILAKGS